MEKLLIKALKSKLLLIFVCMGINIFNASIAGFEQKTLVLEVKCFGHIKMLKMHSISSSLKFKVINYDLTAKNKE